MLALGFRPEVAVRHSLASSIASYAAIMDGRPRALYGVASMGTLSTTGIPWMLSANGIDLMSKSVVSHSIRFHRTLALRFDRLENIVYANNHSAINWLTWLGYTIEPEAPAGPYGAPFRRFWMEV